MQKSTKYYRLVYTKNLRKHRVFSRWVSLISAIYTAFTFWRDEFATAEQQNWRVIRVLPHWPLSWWIAITLGTIIIWLFESSYREAKRLQDRIDELEQSEMPFFERHVKTTVKSLENNIEKIDSWFKYIKQHQQYAFQQLRIVICDEILPTFTLTDTSVIDKSIGDLSSKILRVLKDFKPKGWKDIKAKYDSISQQMNDIICTCPQDSSSPSEQAKLMAPSYIKMLGLKRSMEELATALQDYVEIAKEERE